MKIIIRLLFLLLSAAAVAQDSLLLSAENAFRSRDYQSAFDQFKKAGMAFQLSKRFDQYASCNVQMARCYLATGSVRQAIELADNTHRYIAETLPDSRKLFYESLFIKGEGYLKAGRNDLALEALLLAEQNLPENNSLDAAECFNDLGVIYWTTGNRETALAYHEKALEIRKENLRTTSPLLADSYLNIGLIYLEDEFLQAIIYFNKALKIFQSEYGRDHPKVALCYSNIAFANSGQGNHRDALEYLELTMKIWESTYEGDHPNKAFTLSNKGRIYEAQGNYEQALLSQQEALQQYLRLYGTRHPEVANTHALIGSVLQKKGELKHAVESYQQSIYANLFDQEYTSVYDLPEIRDYYNADILLSSLRSKAQAMEELHFERSLKLSDIAGALETYARADELVTRIRQLRLNEADKIRLGAQAAEVYDNGIRIALYLSNKTFSRGKYLRQAFTFCEASKSATLLEAINETKAKHFAGIPDQLLAVEDSLKTEISWLEQQLAEGTEASTQLKNRLFIYQQAYREFITRLEGKYPNYFRLKYHQATVSVEDLQAGLPENTAALSYFTGTSSIYVFYLTGSDFRVYDLPKKENLQQVINSMRNSLKYRVNEAFETGSSELSEQLIPPIGREISKLIILPDGLLGTIPFEALLINDPGEVREYLISRYAVSYDYAASLLLDKQQMISRDVSGIFLSAPVTFQENEVKMARLDASEKEVREIRNLFRSGLDKPDLYLHEAASETAIKTQELTRYRYLHFATHGIVDESRPELSRIFLSPGPGEDGSLYSGEIYNLDIQADLVTLSACETGLGKVEKGEGIIGLSRSLMYAGGKNLIVSLWQVSDASTALLMIDFYSQHLNHPNETGFTGDLRQAKLGLISSEEYNDPYYWAPFILIGY